MFLLYYEQVLERSYLSTIYFLAKQEFERQANDDATVCIVIISAQTSIIVRPLMSSMSPNFTLKALLHNRQKSPEHSLAGFLPILTFLIGVCICIGPVNRGETQGGGGGVWGGGV